MSPPLRLDGAALRRAWACFALALFLPVLSLSGPSSGAAFADPFEPSNLDGAHGAEALVLGRRLDINEATFEELSLVPGLGPRRAAKIIAARDSLGRFDSIEALAKIPGMGRKRSVALADWLEVR